MANKMKKYWLTFIEKTFVSLLVLEFKIHYWLKKPIKENLIEKHKKWLFPLYKTGSMAEDFMFKQVGLAVLSEKAQKEFEAYLKKND